MQEVIDCDIAPIKKVAPTDMAKYDLIAIGGPIWNYREPANLRLFIYNMPIMTGKMCVPFCSHGAAPSGFMYSVTSALKKKDLSIIGYSDWYGSIYQVLHMCKPYLTDGHPDEIDLKEAEDFGREMANRALRIAAGETDLIPDFNNYSEVDPLWQLHRIGGPNPSDASGDVRNRPKVPPRPQPRRTVNMNKCLYPQCTLCVDNCIVNAIDFSVTPPVIKRHCMQCSLCNRMCPVGAIELDNVVIQQLTQHVINMEKCKYPECTLCVDHCPMNAIDFSVNPPIFNWCCEGDDLCWVICPEGAIEIPNLAQTHADNSYPEVQMINANHGFNKLLELAEAKGKFRRLVPLNEIGWDNPIHKMQKHPRFNIEELIEDD
jgi:ferredoxin/flavodoxin